MPDMERQLRNLELHLAETTEAVAYARGKHAGEDKARWQVAKLTVAIALVVVIASIYFR